MAQANPRDQMSTSLDDVGVAPDLRHARWRALLFLLGVKFNFLRLQLLD
jgi:hypothetical protein